MHYSLCVLWIDRAHDDVEHDDTKYIVVHVLSSTTMTDTRLLGIVDWMPLWRKTRQLVVSSSLTNKTKLFDKGGRRRKNY